MQPSWLSFSNRFALLVKCDSCCYGDHGFWLLFLIIQLTCCSVITSTYKNPVLEEKLKFKKKGFVLWKYMIRKWTVIDQLMRWHEYMRWHRSTRLSLAPCPVVYFLFCFSIIAPLSALACSYLPARCCRVVRRGGSTVTPDELTHKHTSVNVEGTHTDALTFYFLTERGQCYSRSTHTLLHTHTL